MGEKVEGKTSTLNVYYSGHRMGKNDEKNYRISSSETLMNKFSEYPDLQKRKAYAAFNVKISSWFFLLVGPILAGFM